MLSREWTIRWDQSRSREMVPYAWLVAMNREKGIDWRFISEAELKGFTC